MKNLLIVSGHPDLKDSVANKTILEELERAFPEAVIDRLDELYPDFQIDAQAEQKKLLAADVILLQFPLFWYSSPALLHQWMEKTFLHGFSHGTNGTKLRGKKLWLSITVGGPKSAYSHDGAMGFTVEEYLPPFKSACLLTGLVLAGSSEIYGVGYSMRTNPEMIQKQKELCKAYARDLIEDLKKL